MSEILGAARSGCGRGGSGGDSGVGGWPASRLRSRRSSSSCPAAAGRLRVGIAPDSGIEKRSPDGHVELPHAARLLRAAGGAAEEQDEERCRSIDKAGPTAQATAVGRPAGLRYTRGVGRRGSEAAERRKQGSRVQGLPNRSILHRRRRGCGASRVRPARPPRAAPNRLRAPAPGETCKRHELAGPCASAPIMSQCSLRARFAVVGRGERAEADRVRLAGILRRWRVSSTSSPVSAKNSRWKARLARNTSRVLPLDRLSWALLQLDRRSQCRGCGGRGIRRAARTPAGSRSA